MLAIFVLLQVVYVVYYTVINIFQILRITLHSLIDDVWIDLWN